MCSAGQRAGLAVACALVLALAAAPVQCSTDSSTLLQPYAVASDSGDIDLALAASAAGVPLRVDYRDREDVFDLELLGAATGMCSLSGECNACSYREINPCQVADRYGADPSLCQLPSFLGGAYPSDSLCGIGATVDVTLPSAGAGASGSGSGSLPVATLTAFRTRGGKLMITLTARCGWVLLPSDSTSTALNQSSTSSAGASGGDDYAQSSLVILEGDISYLATTRSFTRPAEAAMAGEVERYSCFSTGLRLRGLSSRCQVLDLDLDLRFAVQRLDVIDGGGGGGDAGAVCVQAGPVLLAEAHLSMRSPKARKAATSTSTSTTTTTTTAAAAPVEQATRQQLFSNGVAGTTSYTASVDPRDSEATAWLQSLATQYPVVSVTPSSATLSFLMGALRRDLQQGGGGLATAGSSGGAPLLPAGLHLDTCGRQSISAVVAAVVSALAAQGVTERFVSDVVCLQLPYKEVAVSELPPCAPYTTVLFNVTLEVPLSSATGVTSSLLSSASTASSSSSSLTASSSLATASATAPSPQVLADALVGAQLAAPWACLSTEQQMRMVTRLEVDLQLPNGPGVQTTAESMAAPRPALSPAPSPSSAEPAPPAGSSDPAVAILAPAPVLRGSGGGSQTSFSTAATAAVAVAVALALTVALVAFFAIRSARKSKAAAAAAAEAAAAATAAARAAAGGNTAPAPGAGKLSPLPTAFAQKAAAAAAELPAGLEAEPSYASTCDDPPSGASGGGANGASCGAGSAASGSGVSGGGGGGGRSPCSEAPAEGVLPWASKAVGGECLSGSAPVAAAASLEPFAAAVESAAAAAAATAAAAAASAAVSSPATSTTAALTSQPPPTAGHAAAAAAEGSGPTAVRVLPVTRPPPPLPAAAATFAADSGGISRSPSAAVRAPVSPPGQPALWRRGRMLRSAGASSGSAASESLVQGTGARGRCDTGGMRAGEATVWSNALYDAPQQLYDSGAEGIDTPGPEAVSAASVR